MWIQETGKITNGFYMLGTLVSPVYLLEFKGEWILIEGGLEVHASLILLQLKEILDDIQLLKHWIILHSHYDHCGAIENIKAHIPQLKMYAGKEAIENFANQKYTRKVRELNELVNITQSARVSNSSIVPLTDLPFIEIENSIFSNDLKNWQLIKTPGHSKCSLSLCHIPQKLLFVSDALGEIIHPQKWFPLAFESMNLFKGSVNNLKELDVAYIALGHHGVLSDKEAKEAFHYALKSCDDMTLLVNNAIENEEGATLSGVISNVFGVNDKSFMPPHVYDKSLEQLIHVLKRENYLHTSSLIK